MKSISVSKAFEEAFNSLREKCIDIRLLSSVSWRRIIKYLRKLQGNFCLHVQDKHILTDYIGQIPKTPVFRATAVST
jgi:hypothetical protein